MRRFLWQFTYDRTVLLAEIPPSFLLLFVERGLLEHASLEVARQTLSQANLEVLFNESELPERYLNDETLDLVNAP